MRRSLPLLLTLVLLPSSALAAGRNRAPEHPVAVWQLLGAPEDRALGDHWFTRIADSMVTVQGVSADREREFGPRVQPAEGVTVAIRTAARWLDAAWLAHQRREWGLTLSLIDDSLALVEPYAAERLPEGLRRDLLLLRARTLVSLDQLADARDVLRQAMFLDPSWDPSPRLEPRVFVELAEAVRSERAGVPLAMVRVQANQTNVQVLVSGIERAKARSGVVDLELPPGSYEIAARKPGYAPAGSTITVRPRQESEVELTLEVRNSARFQEQLADALLDPRAQGRSDVWESLRLAAKSVDARAVLSGSFVADAGGQGGTLSVGLFLPGRGGWAFYREVRLVRDTRDAFLVDQLIEQLTVVLNTALHPTTDELASR